MSDIAVLAHLAPVLGNAPSAIAAAIDTSTIPRSRTGELPALRSAPPSQPVSPAWSAAFRSRTAPACPTRPAPSAVTFRA